VADPPACLRHRGLCRWSPISHIGWIQKSTWVSELGRDALRRISCSGRCSGMVDGTPPEALSARAHSQPTSDVKPPLFFICFFFCVVGMRRVWNLGSSSLCYALTLNAPGQARL
jgi:hypothetical protein